MCYTAVKLFDNQELTAESLREEIKLREFRLLYIADDARFQTIQKRRRPCGFRCFDSLYKRKRSATMSNGVDQ